MHNNLRFDSVSWPGDGHECPSYAIAEPAFFSRLLEDISFFTVLADVKALDFVALSNTKPHRRLQHFEDHGCADSTSPAAAITLTACGMS